MAPSPRLSLASDLEVTLAFLPLEGRVEMSSGWEGMGTGRKRGRKGHCILSCLGIFMTPHTWDFHQPHSCSTQSLFAPFPPQGLPLSCLHPSSLRSPPEHPTPDLKSRGRSLKQRSGVTGFSSVLPEGTWKTAVCCLVCILSRRLRCFVISFNHYRGHTF